MPKQSQTLNTAPTFLLPAGLAVTAFGADYMTGQDVAIDKNGQIFMVGSGNGFFNIARYTSNGRLDSHFDRDGIVQTAIGSIGSYSHSLVATDNGQLLVAGGITDRKGQFYLDGELALARYNSDGSLDSQFGENGIVTTSLNVGGGVRDSTVAVQADGNILLAGTTYPLLSLSSNNSGFLTRYHSDGSLDKGFLGGGVLTLNETSTVFNDVMQQANGKILVAGSVASQLDGRWNNTDFALFRFNSNGIWDTSFGSNGKVTLDFTNPDSPLGFPSYDSINAIAQQTDGKILAAGSSWPRLTLTRFLSNGQLDASFGEGGKVLSNVSGSFNDVVLQADGKILVAGTSNDDFVVARYLTTGQLDASFGGDGMVVTDFGSWDEAESLTLTPNGSIIVAGTSNGQFALASYRSDGSLTPGFGQTHTANNAITTTQNAEPVALNRTIAVRDADLDKIGSYAGATLTLQRQTGANAADVFSTRSDYVSFADNRITLDGEDLGTSQQSGGKLSLMFTKATSFQINQVLQNIAYHNTAHEPTQTIKLAWQFSDGDSIKPLTAIGTTTVHLLSDNHLPSGYLRIEGTQASGHTLTATVQELADADGLGALSYQWQSSADGGVSWHNETTGKNIVVSQALLARQIKAVAYYKDGLGYQESVYSILGSQGNDVITSGEGNQLLMGGGGDDSLSSGTGDDVLNGGAGNDTLVCNTEGSKTINGGEGVDWLLCTSQSQGVFVSLDGFGSTPPGNFTRLTSVTGIEHVSGTAFADSLNGDDQANILNGGAGDDTLFGGSGWYINDGGNDSLNGGAGNDTLNGGGGIDWAQYWSAPSGVTVYLTQTSAQNTGGAGIDTLSSIENLNGSLFNDKLTGDYGNNALSGNSGDDLLLGDQGDDSLNGGDGNDILNGGTGSDWAQYWNAKAAVSVDLSKTTPQNTGGSGIDTLLGIEKINGSAFNDKLTGNPLSNLLLGGAGNDVLNGGLGTDLLQGGVGQDSFLFNTLLGAGNTDKISDFIPADDTIQLDNAIFTKLTSTGVLNPALFKIGTAASDPNDYILYNANTGSLSYDADGNGSGAAVPIALVPVGLALAHTDFVVV